MNSFEFESIFRWRKMGWNWMGIVSNRRIDRPHQSFIKIARKIDFTLELFAVIGISSIEPENRKILRFNLSFLYWCWQREEGTLNAMNIEQRGRREFAWIYALVSRNNLFSIVNKRWVYFNRDKQHCAMHTYVPNCQ